MKTTWKAGLGLMGAAGLIAGTVIAATAIPLAFSEFHSGCTAGCSVTSCSCTGTSQNFWTSTTNASNTNAAFRVSFNDGQTVEIDKTSNSRGVRAVRGGY